MPALMLKSLTCSFMIFGKRILTFFCSPSSGSATVPTFAVSNYGINKNLCVFGHPFFPIEPSIFLGAHGSRRICRESNFHFQMGRTLRFQSLKPIMLLFSREKTQETLA